MLNHRKKIQWIIVLVISLTLVSGLAFAQCNHNHGSLPAANKEYPGMAHQMSMADRPIQTAEIQGMKVSLDVMDMGMHLHMQGMKGNPVPDTYNAKQSEAIMVMVQSLVSKETIKNANLTITIISPTGKKQTNKAPWYGDHYGESFSPSEKGTYQIIIKVEGPVSKGEAVFKYSYKG